MELTTIPVPERIDAASVAALRERVAGGPPLLVGAREGVFSDGLALEALDGGAAPIDDFVALLDALAARPLSVAVIDGRATGGGVGLAAACGLVVATPRARISLPELVLGLVPAAIWSALRRRASSRALIALASHGSPIDAEAARALGLVDVVTDRPRAVLRNLRRVDPDARARLLALDAAWEAAGASERSAVIRREAARQLTDPAVRARIARWLEGDAPWT